MKIETTSIGREHTISGLTDAELLIIEDALYKQDMDTVPGNLGVWSSANSAVNDAGLDVLDSASR